MKDMIEAAKTAIRKKIAHLEDALRALDALDEAGLSFGDEKRVAPAVEPVSSFKEDEWITADDAAAASGYSAPHLRKLAREGRIPHLRLSPRRLRFRLTDLVNFVDGRSKYERY